LDCALFSDLSWYGPDTLHSLRSLMLFEAEDKRERQYLSGLLNSGRLAELREELNFGLPDTPQPVAVAILPRSPATPATVSRRIKLSPISLAGAPVQVLDAAADLMNGLGVARPALSVRNTSQKTVVTVNVALLVRDEHAGEFVAAILPERTNLQPGQEAQIQDAMSFQLSKRTGAPLTGAPLMVQGVSPLVTAVEFADGSVWIPDHEEVARATADPALRRVLARSPEQQRLAALFRRDGINAVAAELRKVE
jgi:hypothetical protein